jgi:hypothetical protein
MEDIIGLFWLVICLMQLMQLYAISVVGRNTRKLAEVMAGWLETLPIKKGKQAKRCANIEHVWKQDDKGKFYCTKCGAKP